MWADDACFRAGMELCLYRCVVLRALCDLRCEKDDARFLMDLSHKSEEQQLRELSRGGAKAKQDDLLEPV
jgi:hypothetical protein